jgi:CRP-like cAMP-binding protein
MPYTLIFHNIARHIRLTPEEQHHFSALLKPVTYKRRQIILQPGAVCRHSIFVTDGCLRAFESDKDGIEHVMSFAPAGWWIADMYSLITRQPGTLAIDALEDTTAYTLSKTDQEQLYHEIPQFERFFRILTENSLVANQQRLMDALSLTAEERYLKFCKRYPTLIDTLPHKQIASYIGVTPEFFSRMLKGLSRKF